VSPYYEYRLGGIFDQNLGNFVSFQGYQFGEAVAKNLLSATNTLQFRVAKSYFFDANISIANLFNDLNVDDILHVSHSSAGVTAGYKSPFGQIKVNYSQPFKNKNGVLSVILGHWF
jgi:NTE family protein